MTGLEAPAIIAIIGATAAVAGTAVSIKQSRAAAAIAEWEAKENQKAATLQYKQQELDRTSRLRQAMAQNMVESAVSGISVTGGNVEDINKQNLANYDSDVMAGKTQYLAMNQSIAYQSAASQSAYKMQGYSSLLQGAAGVTNAYSGYQASQLGAG